MYNYINNRIRITSYSYFLNKFQSQNSNISESINQYEQTEYIYDTNFFSRELETFNCLAFLSDGYKIFNFGEIKNMDKKNGNYTFKLGFGGKVYECIIENITEEGDYYIARSYMDVPSEDGVIYVKYDSEYMINEFVDVRITDSTEYDLFGEIIE